MGKWKNSKNKYVKKEDRPIGKTRKDIRKEQRLAKKVRKNQFYTSKGKQDVLSADNAKVVDKKAMSNKLNKKNKGEGVKQNTKNVQEKTLANKLNTKNKGEDVKQNTKNVQEKTLANKLNTKNKGEDVKQNTKTVQEKPLANKAMTKDVKNQKRGDTKKKQFCPTNQSERDVQNEKRKYDELMAKMQGSRKVQMVEANIDEDKEIKSLEKQLRLNKRKTKGISKGFKCDGLDYLLEVCDSENIKGVVESEMQLNQADDGFEEDFALMTKQIEAKSGTKTKKSALESDDDMDVDDEDEMDDEEFDEEDEMDDEEFDEEDEMDDEEFDDEEEEESDNELEKAMEDSDQESNDGDDKKVDNKNKEKKEVWEDIYGRMRDKKGNVLKENDTGKYIPPAIRAKMAAEQGGEADKQRIEKLNKLKRQLKGLMNRLAETNMHSIANQIEELYMRNSRNDMNETITNLILEALVAPILSPERLMLEHVMLIAILHANVGTEVGAHFLQTIVRKFNEVFDAGAEVEDKTLDNLVHILAQLYNFKVFSAELLYEVLKKLIDKFEEKHVECILAVLKNVGFTLRKDDPTALKNLILDLQKRANTATELIKENPRVKFMLEILLAIKNNNVNKIPNYDTTYSEHLKKVMKTFVRRGNYVTQLNISLDDLLKADERGKWWVVGSAWTGKSEQDNRNQTTKSSGSSYSQKLLDLARKQRMNTENRRNIFCILMTAEDYIDAFEKLLHLGLKGQQEREIIHVLMHCCLQEKQSNPYYSYLAQKFCDYDRNFQMIIKCTVWDKMKALTDCSPLQISNMAKLLIFLFIEGTLPISILKILEFSELDKTTLRFTRQILLGILLHKDFEQCQAVFAKVAYSDKLKRFRQSLRLFIHHFLLKNLNSADGGALDVKLLDERARNIEQLLGARDSRTRF